MYEWDIPISENLEFAIVSSMYNYPLIFRMQGFSLYIRDKSNYHCRWKYKYMFKKFITGDTKATVTYFNTVKELIDALHFNGIDDNMIEQVASDYYEAYRERER